MPASLTEITATFIGMRHRKPDWMVGFADANGTINARIVIKGNCDPDTLIRRRDYRFTGHFTTYKGEQQFEFNSFSALAPVTRAGVVEYLSLAGKSHWFGRARAEMCWELFAADAVRMFRESPESVVDKLSARGLRLSYNDARAISAKLIAQQATETCTIELTELLSGRGFRKPLATWLIQDLGSAAADRVRRNPYLLLKYPGCGFAKCDAMYLSLGLPPGRLKRQALCAWYAIDSNTDGHTWMPRGAAEQGIKGQVGGADLKIDRAIRLAVRAGLLVEETTDGVNGPITPRGATRWLSSREKAESEIKLAWLVADAMTEDFAWPDVATIQNIDGEQPGVLGAAWQGTIGILGGRPGTGKTHTAAQAIRTLGQVFGVDAIGIGCPTNLAAARLNQGFADYDVPARARTIHSLLGRPKIVGKKRWLQDENNPFRFKVLVIDECSMVDCEIMAALFAARAKGTLVLLIGDVRQLLPVSHGAPFRDMIAAKLPYGELTEIRRNSGGIVEACKAISEGKPWGEGDNLSIVQVDEEAAQYRAIVRELRNAEAAGLDPVWDTRVIVARNDTRRAVNKLLQILFNKQPGVEGSPFRTGDKIINRESSDFKVIEANQSDPDLELNDEGSTVTVRVANGEVGRVLEVQEKYFIAKLKYPDRTVLIPRGKVPADDKRSEGDKTGTGCSWDLAYAVTFHSSQGSEFPWAILVASGRDGRLGCRELLYTGISRAKQKCKLIGMKATFDRFCRRVALGDRKTLLKERILLEQAQIELAQI
jgi:exodeoxyribonuclease V alpha subunit